MLKSSITRPLFSITNRQTSAITGIERARGFLEAAYLSADWVREVGEQALIPEAHHTTHIEVTRLTLDQANALGHLIQHGTAASSTDNCTQMGEKAVKRVNV